MKALFKGSDKTKLRKAYEKRFGVVEGDFVLYNKEGNRVYFEASKGCWLRWEHDSKGNITFLESSKSSSVSYFNGSWIKSEYDQTGKEVYREDSINGVTIGERPCEVKTITIEGKEYTLTEVKL